MGAGKAAGDRQNQTKTALADNRDKAQIAPMTATEVIAQLQALPPEEVGGVRGWLSEHDEESPALLAAIDEGLRSLAEKGTQTVTRGELEQKVRQWAGASR
jgi:hypothetical protein